MEALPVKTVAEWVVLGLVGSFFLLRLLEAGVKVIGKAIERLWRSIEKTTQGRVSSATGRRVAAHLAEKMKAGAGFAALTIADPFIEIARSFIPQAQPVPSAPPEPVPLQPDLREEAYKAAIARFGLSPSCPERTAAITWVRLRAKGDSGQVDADWKVIADYRGFKQD